MSGRCLAGHNAVHDAGGVLEVLKKELVALRLDVTTLSRALKSAAIPADGIAPLVVELKDLRLRQSQTEAALHASLSRVVDLDRRYAEVMAHSHHEWAAARAFRFWVRPPCLCLTGHSWGQRALRPWPWINEGAQSTSTPAV